MAPYTAVLSGHRSAALTEKHVPQVWRPNVTLGPLSRTPHSAATPRGGREVAAEPGSPVSQASAVRIRC